MLFLQILEKKDCQRQMNINIIIQNLITWRYSFCNLVRYTATIFTPLEVTFVRKGKGSPYSRLPRPLGRGTAIPNFKTSALKTGVGVQHHAPAALPPGKRTGTHCIGGWVGPRVGQEGCGKSRPPPGIDPLTVQPVASRYTD